MLTLKGNNMAVQLDTMEGVVEHGARIFESVEKDLLAVHKKTLDKLIPLLEQANKLGMMGALETGRLTGMAMEAAGHVGTAYRIALEAHKICTDIAIKNEVDPPRPFGGGDR